MIHKPIQINNLSLSFEHKICFENFNTQILYGSRIGIIGRNGSGKSTLLKILQGVAEATSGSVSNNDDVTFGFVPQTIEDFNSFSGGQRFNLALTQALSLDPNILLLDEPTNHLDQRNRKNLIRMLQSYRGTLIIASHDTEVLRYSVDILWHIDHAQLHVFKGSYDNYIREVHNHRTAIEKTLSHLDLQKKHMHNALMREQKRAAKSKSNGEKNIRQKKWPTVVSPSKAGRASETSGRKKSTLNHKKQDLIVQLSNLQLPEIILPKFSLNSATMEDRTMVSISDGSVGYSGKASLLQTINLSIRSRDRIAIQGDNASGKSTLIRAIFNDSRIIKSGDWHIPKQTDIGYLEQHYNTLDPEKTVYETIAELEPTWTNIEVRRHLLDFLFRKNKEVNNQVSQLSGGEKARLTLAQIAAKTPKLLILDEITNNLDLETKEHVIQVLKAYPGAMIVISHDINFLKEVKIQDYYQIIDGVLVKVVS